MAIDTLHVVPHDEGWAVKREGNERASSMHQTQQEAIDGARDLGRAGDHIVIHRADGTIREQLTMSENSNNSNGSKTRLKARDIMSVGTRVSWSAVLAGAAVTIAVYIALSMFGVALGVTTVDQFQADTFTVVATIVSVVFLLVSLFLGGYVTSRLTAGENPTEALIYGVLLWATLFAFLTVSGIGVGAGYRLFIRADPVAGRNAQSQQELMKRLNLSEEQQIAAQNWIEDTRSVTSGLSPTELAWWGFGGMVLSMIAAIFGSFVGVGPKLILEHVEGRRARRAQQGVMVTRAT